MVWIKRNKFFVVCCVLALGMLGAAGFYDYKSWSRNDAAFSSLNEIYGKLKELTSKKPSPGSGKINNIEIAREQERQVTAWIRQTEKYFQPIARIPDGNSGASRAKEFGDALSQTIAQLQHDAVGANVTLPPDFGFSFTAERNRLTFAPGSLDPLAVQLGEVKAISEILFAARVNSLDGVQRAGVSDDDTTGPQSDYISEVSQTNNLAVLAPYQITFRSFSPEIAGVLAGFENSPHGFIVKGINVQRADATTDASGAPAAPMTAPPETPASAMSAGRGGLQTVLAEQLLRVTIEVEIVKLLPRN
jgi:hypothetical protein